MGLLELYNQITNGILPTGDDKKHIDNMPLGNPQWENKNDNVTDYGNTTQITGKITPGQYPAGPIENFTQKYDQNNTYLDQVYTNPNNNQPSPNQDSLDASRLDNQNNPNPDPTVYPNNVNGQLFTQDDWEGSEYDTKVNRNNIVDSPLTDRLGDSDEYEPDEIAGPFNFTPEYNSDREYDSVINRDDITNSPLGNDSLDESNLDDSVVYTGPGSTTPTNIDGTFNFTPPYDEDDDYEEAVDRTSISNSPLTDRLGDSNEYAPDEIAGPFDFENKYSNEGDEEYDDIVNRNSTSNSPLYNSLDDSTLDDSVDYNGPGATTPTDVDGDFNFEPKYTSEEKYDTTISNSPLLDSLDDSTLDDSITYTPPRDYTPDELIGTPNFTPEYNSDSEYDANVGFLEDGSINSPLSNSLDNSDSSDLDDLDNYSSNNDPTIYPIEAQAQGTGAQKYEQKYYNEDGKEYDDIVNRDNTDNSPLANSLDNSSLDNINRFESDPTIYPEEAKAPGNTAARQFSQIYFNKDGREYDDRIGFLEDGSIISNISNSFEGTPILSEEDKITNYPPYDYINFGGTQVNGINPISGKSFTRYTQNYNSNKTYLDTLEENEVKIR